MKRTVLIATLVALHAVLWLRRESGGDNAAGYDPFAPRPRLLAKRLEAAQYADALTLARELHQAFPGEPELVQALARAWRGLGNWSQEAEAWEEYLRVSTTPAEACPALAEAYEAGSQEDRALDAYERCARLESDDPERWFDLARAYARRGRHADALTMARRAAALDPDNPWIQAVIQRDPSGSAAQ